VIADEVQKRDWTPHTRNELVLEPDPAQSVDAQVAGTQIVRRFYYVAVRNLQHHKTAADCYVYLEKVIRLGGPSVAS
jgi:hypothetical protein